MAAKAFLAAGMVMALVGSGLGLPPGADAWERDAPTGLRYRAALAEEREAEGWPEGTWLVEVGAGHGPGVAGGALLLPGARGVARVALAPAGVEGGVPYVALGLGAEGRVLEPRFQRFAGAGAELTEGMGGWVARAPGSLVLGPEAEWVLAPLPGAPAPGRVSVVLPAPQGPVPGPDDHCTVHVGGVCVNLGGGGGPSPACSNGRDDDNDRWVDWPDDPGCTDRNDTSELDTRVSYRFALLGEAKWCTRNKANWGSLLNTVGRDVGAAFDSLGATRADLLQGVAGCWLAANMTFALHCDTVGGCVEDNTGHNYTYNACNSQAACYRDRAWADVAHYRQHYTFVQLKAAQVQHDGAFAAPGHGACGLPRAPPGGDGVVPGPPAPAGCQAWGASHGMGHLFGASDTTAPDGACGSAMAPDGAFGCRNNTFLNGTRAQVNACVADAACPRSGTG